MHEIDWWIDLAGSAAYEGYKRARATQLVKRKGLNNNRTHDRQPWTIVDLLMKLGSGPAGLLATTTRVGPSSQADWLSIAHAMLATCKSHAKFATVLEQTYDKNGLKALLAELETPAAGKGRRQWQ